MEKNNFIEEIDQNSWFNCIGELDENNKNKSQRSQSSDSDLDKKFLDKRQIINEKTKVSINQQLKQKQSLIAKRRRNHGFTQDEFNTQNSSNQIKQHFAEQDKMCLNSENMTQYKKIRQTKQSQYSKKYRQRKKQTYKTLFQQNKLLKQKISQLEFRLRQKQLEISRYKYAPPQKQFSIQELNAQFMKNVNVLFEDMEKRPQSFKGVIFQQKNEQFNQFAKSFNTHGFGGTKKKEYLNYYMNQILQGLLKDSQRYLMILFSQSKDNGETIKGPSQYEPINQAFFYVIDQLTEDKLNRLKYISRNLCPMYMQYKRLCSDMLKNFQNILSYCDKIHKFMKQTYLTQSKDLGYKRVKLQTWFEFHKHGKLMRNLRSQWMQLLKTQNQNAFEFSQKKGKKRTNKNEKS